MYGMKKMLFLMLCAALLSACGGSSEPAKDTGKDTIVTEELKNDAQRSDSILQESKNLDSKADSLLKSI
jgi:ABC-type glycerol-3-phosphate transport system substrate-binding protein